MKRAPPRSTPARGNRERLLYELEVHKVELEMQNEALREDRELLEKSQTRYAELYELAPVGHLTLDRSGSVQELNIACAALLGKERTFLRGKLLRVRVAPGCRARLDAHIRACFLSQGPLSVELMVPLAGGGFRAVELVSAPAPPVAGETFPTFHSVLIDVSARKRDDERRDRQLRHEHEARVLAESVNRAKEDFLTVVSHELRTPLIPMMMWVRALRAGGMNETLRRRAIEAIDECLGAEVAMIDDLVDVARGRHGKLRIDQRLLDLQPIVSAAVEAIAPSAAAKQIELTMEVDAAPAWVTGDPVRLRQVVGNLLSNAVKFTREAGHVGVSLHAHVDDVVLTVRDDGEGIEAELLGGVFEPFRQFDQGTARRHGGLGLGLTIVRQLVEEHDGRVTAESAGPGRGSCFTVALPRADGASRPDSSFPPVHVAPPREAAGVLEGIAVLVVEDHAATREALESALRTHGAVVMTAASASAARKTLARERPDVVVSDVSMPREDGYTFVRKLRESESKGDGRRRLPAIALTARATPNDRALALAAGFDSHFAKPIAFDQLLSRIGALARHRDTPYGP
jgi:PAS domain S-box-containing protein